MVDPTTAPVFGIEPRLMAVEAETISGLLAIRGWLAAARRTFLSSCTDLDAVRKPQLYIQYKGIECYVCVIRMIFQQKWNKMNKVNLGIKGVKC